MHTFVIMLITLVAIRLCYDAFRLNSNLFDPRCACKAEVTFRMQSIWAEILLWELRSLRIREQTLTVL